MKAEVKEAYDNANKLLTTFVQKIGPGGVPDATERTYLKSIITAFNDALYDYRASYWVVSPEELKAIQIELNEKLEPIGQMVVVNTVKARGFELQDNIKDALAEFSDYTATANRFESRWRIVDARIKSGVTDRNVQGLLEEMCQCAQVWTGRPRKLIEKKGNLNENQQLTFDEIEEANNRPESLGPDAPKGKYVELKEHIANNVDRAADAYEKQWITPLLQIGQAAEKAYQEWATVPTLAKAENAQSALAEFQIWYKYTYETPYPFSKIGDDAIDKDCMSKFNAKWQKIAGWKEPMDHRAAEINQAIIAARKKIAEDEAKRQAAAAAAAANQNWCRPRGQRR
jgi:hypothetical protein